MTEKIQLVKGDTRPAIACTLSDDATQDAIDLTGATVRLKFRATGATTLTATLIGSVIDAQTGACAFYPASAPEMLQGEAGQYEGEIEITFADGQVQTVFDVIKFKVREDF